MEKISEINGVAPGKLGRSRFYLSYKILIFLAQGRILRILATEHIFKGKDLMHILVD